MAISPHLLQADVLASFHFTFMLSSKGFLSVRNLCPLWMIRDPSKQFSFRQYPIKVTKTSIKKFRDKIIGEANCWYSLALGWHCQEQTFLFKCSTLRYAKFILLVLIYSEQAFIVTEIYI